MSPTPRPPDVRIDDLAAPRFSSEVEALLAGMRQLGAGLELREEPLLDAARTRTGLTDFGPDDFRERLRVLLRAFDEEAGLSPAGRFMQWQLLVQLLRNRLLIQDLLARHPEIHDVPVDRPIIICGLPRTGTTHLHNLLAADPALRALPYWEALEPVLPAAERPLPGERDPRLARTEQALAFIEMALPYFKRMHEMKGDNIHEEIQLLAIELPTVLYELPVN